MWILTGSDNFYTCYLLPVTCHFHNFNTCLIRTMKVSLKFVKKWVIIKVIILILMKDFIININWRVNNLLLILILIEGFYY